MLNPRIMFIFLLLFVGLTAICTAEMDNICSLPLSVRSQLYSSKNSTNLQIKQGFSKLMTQIYYLRILFI